MRRRVLLALSLFLLLAALGLVASFYFSPNLLCIANSPTHADAIVVLGGEPQCRPPRALEIFQQHDADKIIITGIGDWQETQTLLVGKGVPEKALHLDTTSRTTRENALNSVRMLHEMGAKKAILVTSWFHSRRALKCFRHYAPDIEFISVPTTKDLPKGAWPETRERRWVFLEYAKLFYYWLRFGISPF